MWQGVGWDWQWRCHHPTSQFHREILEHIILFYLAASYNNFDIIHAEVSMIYFPMNSLGQDLRNCVFKSRPNINIGIFIIY